MTKHARLRLASVIAALVCAATIVPVAGATGRASSLRFRTCFYHANSGWGLWATPNVSCVDAHHVYNDSVEHLGNGRIDATVGVAGYRCKLDFDGGGSGLCTASHGRAVKFAVP